MAPIAEEMKALVEDIQASARERTRTLAEFLTDCREERQTRAREIRTDLADAEADRMRAFQEMHERVTGRVRELADETRSDMQEAHGAWQGLAAWRSGALEGMSRIKRESHRAEASDAKEATHRGKEKQSKTGRKEEPAGPKRKPGHAMRRMRRR